MNSPVSFTVGKTCSVFKATMGKSHKYRNVSERLLYRCQRGWGKLSAVLALVYSVRGKGTRPSASSEQPNSMKISSAAPLLCWQSTFYFPFCLAHLSLTSSRATDVKKEILSLPWRSGAFPWGPSGAGPSNPNTAAAEPRLSSQGAHLLIMLLHRFSGVTGAELGPLCPTQVTEETAAITQISLSHSNYLTDLASRYPSSCSPRALGVQQHIKVQDYFLHKWEVRLGSIQGVHITYPSTEKHNRAPMRAENGFRKQSINLRCYLSDSRLISAGCC